VSGRRRRGLCARGMEETRLSPHTASEPFRPTVVVRNRYSTWPRGPFSRGRFPKRPRFPLAHARMPLYGHWWGCRATQVTWQSLGITWHPHSGTNRIHLARRFAPTWHRELRRSTRGGGRSKMMGSPRSQYEGNLTAAAHGVGAFYPYGRSQKPLLCFGSGAVLARSLGKSAHTWQRRTRG